VILFDFVFLDFDFFYFSGFKLTVKYKLPTGVGYSFIYSSPKLFVSQINLHFRLNSSLISRFRALWIGSHASICPPGVVQVSDLWCITSRYFPSSFRRSARATCLIVLFVSYRLSIDVRASESIVFSTIFTH